MKKIIFCLTAILLFNGVVWAAPLRVISTTEDLAAIAHEVGGALVKVESLTRGSQDPHYLDTRPSLMLKVSRADLFIQIGLGLEMTWAPAVLVGARNPGIQPGSNGFLDVSRNINALEISTGPVDRSQGDVHSSGNPHYWLDPENGKIISEAIAQKMIALLPNHMEEIERNQKDFVKRLNEAMGQWQNRMKPYEGAKVVTYHNSWTYLEKRFGLNVVGYVEPKPGISPSSSHINQLVILMKREKVKVIVMEPYFSPSIPELLARETGAKILVLPPSVGGAEGLETYFDLFEHITKQLTNVFSKG